VNDHADVLRYELRGLPDALAALDALVAERDEAQRHREINLNEAVMWKKGFDESEADAERLTRCLEREQNMGSAGLVREARLREALAQARDLLVTVIDEEHVAEDRPLGVVINEFLARVAGGAGGEVS
jgi:hypothetical protein